MVIGLCIKVHRKIGAGCYENVYEEALVYELHKANIHVARQVLMPVKYEELVIERGYKLDLLVDHSLIIEIKAQSPMPPLSFNQIRTHLSLMNLKYGMLVNFDYNLVKDSIYRVFNNDGRESMLEQ